MIDLKTIFYSPIFALIPTLTIVIAIFTIKKDRPPIQRLISKALTYIGIFLLISLFYTIFVMCYYQWTTGYSAGNGPLGWIFIYAPLSIATGIIFALFHWLYKDVYRK